VNPRAERPQLVWAGDGGSVGLGHVYLRPDLVRLEREGRRDDAITRFVDQQHAHVPVRILRPHFAERLANVPRDGIAEELARLKPEDPARAWYLFLMLNDQRRHLAYHYDDLDLHRLELHLPFYDSCFIESVVRAPIDLCLGHRFYLRWLKHFSIAVNTVPWQAYPGHEPCPLPIPETLGYQWSRRGGGFAGWLRRVREPLPANLFDPRGFPADLLHRRNLLGAALLHRTGVRSYKYLFKAAVQYRKYWAVADGIAEM
jgi:asparagine synthase (glutamine-hydrolysing)